MHFKHKFLIIIIIILSFFCQKFLRHISRRCLDQTLWNLVGISNAMWSDSLFFGLSRSTRCGYCSYQVSSISVWRVTRYDHFCLFHFFSILAISMVTAAKQKRGDLNFFLIPFIKLYRNIHRSVWQLLRGWTDSKWWPKSTLKGTTSHGIWYSYKVS
jgi:hypothetical protein